MQLAEQHVGYDPRRFSLIGDRDGMANYYAGRAEAKNAAVLVAEDDGKVIGFAYFEFEPVLYAELAVKVAWLHDIYVDEAARGSGAGKMLLDVAAVEAKHLGAKKMLLSVAAFNVAGKEFFERNGFVTTMHEMMLVFD
jgi:L-amino acid N-acyltransferase YncA